MISHWFIFISHVQRHEQMQKKNLIWRWERFTFMCCRLPMPRGIIQTVSGKLVNKDPLFADSWKDTRRNLSKHSDFNTAGWNGTFLFVADNLCTALIARAHTGKSRITFRQKRWDKYAKYYREKRKLCCFVP